MQIDMYENRYPVKVHNSHSRSVDQLHMHGYLQVFCVKQGTCIHDLSGYSGKINPGEISIAPPMNAHRIDGRNDDYEMFGMDASEIFFRKSARFRQWNFFDSCLSPLYDAVSERGHILRPRRDVSADVFRLYDELKSIGSDEGEDKLTMLLGKTIELMSLITSEYSQREGGVARGGATGNCEPIYATFKFIHNNYRDDISTERIAKEAMISERSLYRMFEECMNVTVYQYIQYLRLEHSKLLLRYTKKNVKDVANDSGFAYLPNFHRFFRDRTGVSPNEYRESFCEITTKV